jgi:hypothetical protein
MERENKKRRFGKLDDIPIPEIANFKRKKLSNDVKEENNVCPLFLVPRNIEQSKVSIKTKLRFLLTEDTFKTFQLKYDSILSSNYENDVLEPLIIENLNSVKINYQNRVKYIKINPEILKKILESHLNQHLSLEKIRQEYYKLDCNIKFSLETLRKFLNKRMGIYYKRVFMKNSRLNQNRFSVITSIFLNEYIKALNNDCEFIYMDESCFNNTNARFMTWTSEKMSNLLFYPGRLKSQNLILAVYN